MKNHYLLIAVLLTVVLAMTNASGQTITNNVLYISEGTVSIPNEAYRGRTDFKQVVFPSSLKTIGNKAFQSCINLERVNIPSTVENIGSFAFRYCSKLEAIIVSEANPNYSSDDGVLFSKDKSILICYPAGKINNSYEIPNTVKTISQTAFAVVSVYFFFQFTSVISFNSIILNQ